MKKLKVGLIYLFVVIIISTQSGCIGTFSLTKKIWDFNKSMGDKYAQEAVFLLLTIIPVYELCLTIDAIFLNLIEFWSGSNPVTMKQGDKETQKMVLRGTNYKVTATHNKFIIEKELHNQYVIVGMMEYKNNAWYSSSEMKEHKLIGYNSNGQVEVYAKDNKVYTMDKNLASARLLKSLISNESLAKR